MRSLENENDPRILKELLKMAQSHIEYQNNLITKLQAKNETAKQEKFKLEESLLVLRNKFFGKSSEKSADRSRVRGSEDPELLVHSQNILPPIKEKSLRKLAEEEVIYELSTEELIEASKELGIENPQSEQWEKVSGLFEQSTIIDVVERSYRKVIHKRQKYKLKKEFNKTEKDEVLITADGPTKLLPGATYSIDFAVTSVVDKYLNHLPLERQCRMMDSLGLMHMKPQTLYNLAKTISIYLEPVVLQIKNEILSNNLIHVDETTWPINNRKDSDGYMWVVANNRGSYYQFEPTRSGKVIQEALQDYSGTILTDGYSGYFQYREDSEKNFNKNKLAMCHAHARRYFFEIKEVYPEVQEYLVLYEKLFKVEKLARDFNELKTLRQSQSKAILEEMRLWLLNKYPDTRAETKLKTAIEYTTKNWRELKLFLDEPEVPLTNNEAERTIRQAVMGRKNFYGSRSIDGADVTAIIYSVIESCKKVELDPRKYLLDTIRQCAEGKTPLTPFEYAKSLRQVPA